MSTPSIFQALDFFVLRTPLLPTEVFHERLTGSRELLLERLAELAQDPLIREAIAVSSLSLLHSLPHLTSSNPRKQDQAAKGFLRYLLRMTTRPTPFGLFSGVTYGTYGNFHGIRLREPGAHKKRTRPDMEWLLRLIGRLEQDPAVVRQLHVTANSLTYAVGSRLQLPYVTRYGQIKSVGGTARIERTSVRLTDAVELALEKAQAPIPYEELIAALHGCYPDTSHEQINQFLWQLFEQEFLISDLRPPLMDVSPLDYVLAKLEPVRGIDEIKSGLQEVAERIAEYDAIPVGAGEAAYHRLLAKMKDVADGKNLVQVDLAVQTDELQLPRCVQEEVGRVADRLWRLSNDVHGLPHMSQYRNDFIEKYGSSREIPLLQMLDEDIGLGAPATYEYPRSNRRHDWQPSAFQQRKTHLLSQWLMPVLLQGGQELLLTDEHVSQLAGDEVDARYAPRSFELFFQLAAPSKEAVEAGDFTLVVGGAPGSFGAGKSIGRFVDMLNPELRGLVREAGEREQAVHPDAILAELVYLPGTGRAANVVLTSNPRDYEIVIGTTSSKPHDRTIPLSDLVVGIDGTGFYLRSRRLGREVIPVTNHMLNTTQTPNVYRFLRELTQERQRNIDSFTWGELDSLPYLPRVKYGRCVLAAARWKLSAHLPAFGPEMSDEAWDEAFQAFRREWNLPRFVFLTQTDNRILLDLEQATHIEEIRRDYARLGAGQSVILTELGMAADEFPEGGQGRYVLELAFPLVKRADLPIRRSVTAKPETAVTDAERLKLPGGEWMFVKWYGVQDRVDEFLAGPLREFCAQAEQQQWAKRSFFMRYADPAPHIRLRFGGEPQALWTQLLPHLHGFAQHCVREGMLSRMVIDTYEPEVERYGGPELISLAEQWFEMDSKVVQYWLSLREGGQMQIPKDLLAVVSVLDIMEQFGYGFEEQLEELNRMVDYRDYQELFRPQRSEYLKLADARNGFAGLAQHQAGPMVLPALQGRSAVLRRYAEEVAARERAGMTGVRRLDVMQSVIHMHLNRLYGIEREDEKRVLCLARHALYSLGPLRRASV